MRNFLAILLAASLAACATTQNQVMEPDWGPSQAYRPPEPLVLPARDSPLARRQRCYQLKRLSLDEEGPLVGYQRCQWPDLESFLRLSGAGEQASKLKSIGRSKAAWNLATDLAGFALFFGELGRIRHERLAKDANTRAGQILDQEHLAAARAQMAKYNQRLAAALGLAGGNGVLPAPAALPPPFTRLNLHDLSPGESWEDWIPAYTLSRRESRWRLGDQPVSGAELSAFLTSCGYDKAADAIHSSSRPGSATAVEHAAAQYNGLVPTRLRLRAEECARNPLAKASMRP